LSVNAHTVRVHRVKRGAQFARREPSQAADYLPSVGLSGPFWGL